MRSNIRTVWLLGFIALVAPAAGCIESHHGSHYTGSSPSCLDNQYFEIEWGIDHGKGTLPLTCADIRGMGSSVVLVTNEPAPYDSLPVEFYLSCDDRATCADGAPCSTFGTTASNLPVGTTIVEADLIGSTGAVLSSAGVAAPTATTDSQYTISSCGYGYGSFVFTIAP